jgi:7,8-dihydropterin-6-yl-methyl-4-(beta-D-ribofuranosyl)aminobenzene 5'-phosphate synthase
MRAWAFFVLLASVLTAPCAPPELEIRIIYDNTSVSQDYAPDWGFAALVSHRGRHILFDAGRKADLFMGNFRKLGIDLRSVSQVLISHEHADHTGGVSRLAPLNPGLIFYFLDRFPPGVYEDARKAGISPKRATGPFELAPGVYSTGAVDGAPPEQSLLIETTQGLVIVTGCSHPGIAKIIETAEKQRGKDSVRLLIGGFHMLKHSPEQIAATVSRLRQLKVSAIMPAHCTGELAIAKFREAYGAKFDTAGAGKRIVLD